MEEIKDRLKALRNALNLKQREVAERLGVRVGHVGNWESGVAAIPSTRIYQLCKEYNVRREWLETGVGEMFEPEATFEEKLAYAAKILYDELSERGKAAVLKAMSDKINDAPYPARPDQPRSFDDFYRLVAKNDQNNDDGEIA